MSFSRLRLPLLGLWNLGLAWHASVGLLVLLALSAYVKTGYGCISDEGSYALQAISIAEHDAWNRPDRTGWIDPEGKSKPGDGYTKHPFYPWILSKGYGLFGNFGLILPSILGTVLAGVAAWLLLGAQSGSWRRAGFWLTLLCTPLYVYSMLIFGHALATGAAGFMLWALLKWRAGSNAGWLALALGSAAVLPALRSEGTLLLAAMGGALGLEAVRHPEFRRRNLIALLACGTAFLAVTLLERNWHSEGVSQSALSRDLSSWRLARPLAGTFKALLRPGEPIQYWANFLLLSSALTIPFLGRRCREGHWKTAAGFALLPAAGYLLWALSWQDAWVSGLILTCPLLWFGLWCRPQPWPRDLLFVAGASALFLLAVVATQGPRGGGLEWGGRYLAIGLPFLVLLSVSGLASLFSIAPARARTAIASVGIAVSLLVLGTATHVLRSSHDKNRERSDELSRLAARAQAAGSHPVNGNQPILLTNQHLLPTIHWPDFERFNWILTTRRAPAYYLESLREKGIRGFVLCELEKTKDSFLPALAAFGYEVRESKAYPIFNAHLILARTP